MLMVRYKLLVENKSNIILCFTNVCSCSNDREKTLKTGVINSSAQFKLVTAI